MKLFRKNESDQIQSYNKSPYTHRQFQKESDNTKRHQNINYRIIADRLRTVSLSSGSHTTGVVEPVYGIQTFKSTYKAV